MTHDRPPVAGEASEAFWREFLTHGYEQEKRIRNVLRHIPAGPRCRLCAAPFHGAGAPLMRLIGKRQSNANPHMCTTCSDFMIKHRGGAEIEATFLFADIRGSTTLAEGMAPGEFHVLLNRFYAAASAVVFEQDGLVDKFVGDELVASFFPLIAGERYSARAIRAAQEVLRATGHADAGGPWVPVGAGVHHGRAWVGAIGDADHVEITAVGDIVNTTARLASAAEAGEVIVSVAAAEAAGLEPTLERRALELKGKSEATEVVSLRVARSGA